MTNAVSEEKCECTPNLLQKLTTGGSRHVSRAVFILKLIGAVYALFLLNNLVIEFRHISAKLDRVDGMALDISRLSGNLSSLNGTNAGIKRMEDYMRYLTKNSKDALGLSCDINNKLEITNARLIGTNACMLNTAGKLMNVTDGLTGMKKEMQHMRGSVDQMAAGFSGFGGMQRILERTSSSVDKTATGVKDVTAGIDRVGGGLDEMRELLKSMSAQFAVLPEMKQSLDTTNSQLTQAFSTIEPISREIPRFTASIQEMNETSRQMNKTTQDMAANLRKTHKQGVLGIAVLTAAGLAH